MSAAHVLDDAQLAALSTRSSAQRAAVLLAIDHLPTVPAGPHAALLDEARGWMADCGMEDVDEASDSLVVELVGRQYDGGWPSFVVTNVELLEVTSTRWRSHRGRDGEDDER